MVELGAKGKPKVRYMKNVKDASKSYLAAPKHRQPRSCSVSAGLITFCSTWPSRRGINCRAFVQKKESLVSCIDRAARMLDVESTHIEFGASYLDHQKVTQAEQRDEDHGSIGVNRVLQTQATGSFSL